MMERVGHTRTLKWNHTVTGKPFPVRQFVWSGRVYLNQFPAASTRDKTWKQGEKDTVLPNYERIWSAKTRKEI